MAFATRRFTKEELTGRGLPHSCNGGKIIEDKIVDKRRWADGHDIIFRFDEQPEGEAYRAGYDIGSTESCDERPWEYEDTIDAEIVRLVERTVKVWEPVEV